MSSTAAPRKSNSASPLPITELTLRAFQGGNAIRVVAFFATIPILAALIYLIGSGNESPRQFLNATFQEFLASRLIPIATLILATNALGNELEDRTMVYLVLKPISRLRIVVEKFLAVAITGTALMSFGGTVAWLLVTRSSAAKHLDLLAAMMTASLFAVLAYGAIFMAVSLIVPRALLVGMLYTLVWEVTFASFLPGVRLISVRHYVVSIFGHVLGEPAFMPSQAVGLVASTIVLLVTVAGALLLAAWRLRTMNLE
ncbi:MAG: hypothetical protein DCC58_18470 [Chloroflexi bacterium]|nr:MAG: hypothetical protein DCC58_18470 [Chloroflexota bacterium]